MIKVFSEDFRTGYEAIGPMPIIASYLRRMKIADFVNFHTGEVRSNGRRMSHGDTTFVILLFLFCRPHVVSKVEDWVNQTMYLRMLYPEIKSGYFSEARIQDTLDAIHKAGISNIMFHQCAHICEEFKLDVGKIFVDITNFSVYGDYEKVDESPVLITYGCPKNKRTDLKQFSQEIAVTGDFGIPIHSKTLDGNTADVTRYWPVWMDLGKLLGKTDFLIVGDCKLTSNENLVNISKNNGYYLGPEFMTDTKKLRKDLSDGYTLEVLMEKQKRKDHTVVYSGFEKETTITDPVTGKAYFQRRICIHSTQLEADRKTNLHNRIATCKEKFAKIQENASLNKYATDIMLRKAIEKTIAALKLTDIVSFDICEEKEILKKAKGRGRPGKNTEYMEKTVTRYRPNFAWNEDEIEQQESECGFFVLVTNKPTKIFPMQEALDTYKKESKVESVFAKLKGPLQVIPIRLELPQRIESIMYMLTGCLQIMTLIEKTAEEALSSQNKKLHGLFPRNRGVEKPKSEFMLDALRKLSLDFVQFGEETQVKIGRLNGLQLELLELMGTEKLLYDSQYCSEQLCKSEKLDPIEFKMLLCDQILSS